MKDTILLTKMARAALIAGLISGITGAAYAQVGGAVGGAAAGGGGAVDIGSGITGQTGPATSGTASGQAGSEMSGMSEGVPNLEQTLPRREQDVPGLVGPGEPRGAGATAESSNPSRVKVPSLPRY